jgi:hypothetical protein
MTASSIVPIPMSNKSDNNVSIVCSGSTVVAAAVICPLLWIPLNFYLFLTYQPNKLFDEHGVQQIPTISLAGSYDPSSQIMTFGMHLESVLLALACLALYFFINSRLAIAKESIDLSSSPAITTASFPQDPVLYASVDIESPPPSGKMYGEGSSSRTESACTDEEGKESEEDNRLPPLSSAVASETLSTSVKPKTSPLPIKRLELLNGFCLFLGFGAALSMSGVGSITMLYNEQIHTYFALGMFLTGIGHMVFFYFFILPYFPTSFTSGVQRFLIVLALLIAIPVNISMIVLSQTLPMKCDVKNTDCTVSYVNFEVMPEFTTITALLLYIASFYFTLQDVIFVQMIRKSALKATTHASSSSHLPPSISLPL